MANPYQNGCNMEMFPDHLLPQVVTVDASQGSEAPHIILSRQETQFFGATCPPILPLFQHFHASFWALFPSREPRDVQPTIPPLSLTSKPIAGEGPWGEFLMDLLRHIMTHPSIFPTMYRSFWSISPSLYWCRQFKTLVLYCTFI